VDELINLFARVLEVDVNSINEQSSPENLDNWDSLKFMQLVAEFESEFNVSLDISTIMGLKNFSDFKRLLTKGD
jgi:acyl carrier protein